MVAGEWVLFGVVALVLAGAATYQAVGPELKEPTELDADGVVCVRDDSGDLAYADPAALARGRKASPTAYALGRVIQSEVGTLPLIAQIGVAWTVKNRAAALGKSVLELVTAASFKSGNDAPGDGYFGRQGGTGGYRYCSSAQDASDDAQAVAASVDTGDTDDPTGGAVNFDSPDSYGAQAGTDASGADTFAANRRAEGKELVTLPGVSSSAIRFWRPA